MGKKKKAKVVLSESQKFGKAIRDFEQFVPKEQRVVRQPLPPPVQSSRVNFFEHRSNKEVYGDDDLKLFDSQKVNRIQNTTGGFFGF